MFPPAANMFPPIQKVARALIIVPLFILGINSEKYEKMTGIEPPTLQEENKNKSLTKEV